MGTTILEEHTGITTQNTTMDVFTAVSGTTLLFLSLLLAFILP
jgi:hypothetical protein